jgi:glutathione S-transferase
MALTLYYHPIASFCWKALIALYETSTPFHPVVVDLGDAASRAAFAKVWPPAKFPVLHDPETGLLVPESSIVIEWLAEQHPGEGSLLPADADRAREARLQDRFFDGYVQVPMQKIVGDRIRPADRKDPLGVEEAHQTLDMAFGMIEARMAGRRWAVGDGFTMADCSAAPALYYANRVHPFGAKHPSTAAYLERLLERPSFARVMAEAAPLMHLFPE